VCSTRRQAVDLRSERVPGRSPFAEVASIPATHTPTMRRVSHYCVNCGIRLQPCTIEERTVDRCEECGFTLWRDPKVVTCVVVEDAEGRVVVGRRSIEPAYGRWCLPGGYVNDDEHPALAAARECREEIGADVDIVSLLGVYHIPKRGAASMVGIAYGARLRPGEVPVAGSEMLEV